MEEDERYSKLPTTRRERYLAAKESAKLLRRSIIDEEYARILKDDENLYALGILARQKARDMPKKVK